MIPSIGIVINRHEGEYSVVAINHLYFHYVFIVTFSL